MSTRRDYIKGSAAMVAATLLGGAAKGQSASPGRPYALTATPRPWTVQQRPGPPIAIDVHTHWAPDAYLKAKAKLGQPDFLEPINHDLDRRRKWMDAHGIQMLVLTLGGFRPWPWVTPGEGAEITRVTNDAAIAAHAAYPDRFVGGIELNVSDPAGSLRELARVAGTPGMVCVHLPTSLAGRDYLFEPAFAPVLARTQELGLPILLHPLDGELNWFGGRRLADRASGAEPTATGAVARFPGLTNSLGNSLEMAVVMSKMMSSGLLDDYPELIFIATCGGGALPLAAARIDGRGGARLKRPVTEYLRRFYYDSLVWWPHALRFLIDTVGADRVVLGSDNMFGPGAQLTEQPLSLIDQIELSPPERDMILRGNLKRVFKL